MKLSTLMVINAILAAIFGVTFIIAPGQAFPLYGFDPNPQLNLMGQLWGGFAVGFAVLTWSARNVTESEARRAIVLALFVAPAIGFIVALIAQLGGVVNAFGWSTVAIYLLLAIGFGYFQFTKPTT
ncbi:MAG: hypothetical protein V3S46_08080 [Nitrospinota bacterium]